MDRLSKVYTENELLSDSFRRIPKHGRYMGNFEVKKRACIMTREHIDILI